MSVSRSASTCSIPVENPQQIVIFPELPRNPQALPSPLQAVLSGFMDWLLSIQLATTVRIPYIVLRIRVFNMIAASGKMENILIMTPSPALSKSPLADTILFTRLPEESIQQLVRQIQQDVLAHSRYLREPDFRAIHPHDLQFLFGAYDERFFCRTLPESFGGAQT